jgi:WhiB family redox-sensing transcriptional regulator
MDPLVPEWMLAGLCRQVDPDLFYPEDVTGALRCSTAQRICAGCPVKGECLDYALSHDERYGVWGGMSANARRKLVNGGSGRYSAAQSRASTGVG